MPGSKYKIGYTAASGKTSLVDRMNLSIHLRKYIKLISRRWVFLVLGAAIGAGYMWNQTSKMPDQFYARSKAGLSPVLTGVAKDPVQVAEEMARFYQTQMDYMTSDEVLGRVQEKLKDWSSAPGVELGTSASIVMHVRGTDYEKCRLFAEAWADEFIAFKDRQKEGLINKEAAEIKLKYEREKEKLEAYRKEMDAFLARHGANAKDVGDLAQDQLASLKQRQLGYRLQREFLQNQSLEQFVEERKTEPKAAPGNNGSGPQPAGEEPRARGVQASDLRELKRVVLIRENERDRWVGKLKGKHPYMQYLVRQVEDAKEQMDIARRLAEQGYEETLRTLEASEKALDPMIAEQSKMVESARRVQEEFKQLQLKYDQQAKSVEDLNAQVKLLSGAKTEDEKLYVMERGKGSPNPTGPDRQKMILNGLMIGLAIGFGIVYLLNRMDDRLELAEDIEDELDEPVLGQIPQLDESERGGESVLITRLDQHNTFAEAMRGVRSAFLFGFKDIPKQVIVVTSAVPGDGKTTITTNFATTLAKAGNKVLLIDADLRRGNIHGYFGLERGTGFTEVLIGEVHWEDVALKTEVENLTLITTGKLPGNPGELLISPIAEHFISEARSQYDYVLFDCPPLTSIDDTFCLLSLVDSMLFVVKAGHTSMRFAKNALAQVRHRGSNISGIVLNGITTDHPGYYYYYYYHDYYKTAQDAKSKGHILPNAQPGQKMARRRTATLADERDAKAKADSFKAKRNAGQPHGSIAVGDDSQKADPQSLPPGADEDESKS